ncbi:chemotaxis protein [Roseateles sp. DC23W]|uniref:Chemotaxis protein n=1 Tax=Pelomonas dachongensis TaxID=3299029 RepID=A0ABW7EH07_9BURK
MGHSSLLGIDKAPQRPQGTDEEALGPSDSTDSGSDTLGADRLPAADPGEPVDVTLSRDQALAPIEGTGEDSDETEASDIGVDRIIEAPDNDEPLVDAEFGTQTARR